MVDICTYFNTLHLLLGIHTTILTTRNIRYFVFL